MITGIEGEGHSWWCPVQHACTWWHAVGPIEEVGRVKYGESVREKEIEGEAWKEGERKREVKKVEGRVEEKR